MYHDKYGNQTDLTIMFSVIVQRIPFIVHVMLQYVSQIPVLVEVSWPPGPSIPNTNVTVNL